MRRSSIDGTTPPSPSENKQICQVEASTEQPHDRSAQMTESPEIRMPTRMNLWSTRTLAAVAGTVGSLALAAPMSMAATPERAFTPSNGTGTIARAHTPETIMAGVQKAGNLAEAGRYLEARRDLSSTLEGAELSTLTLAQRGEVHRLVRELDRRIERMDPVELSLGRASLALDEGDLIGAERHASRILDREGVPVDQINDARDILENVRERRMEMLAVLPQALDAAGSALDAGDVEQARAWVSMVVRSGVELSPSRRERLESYQLAVITADRGHSSTTSIASATSSGRALTESAADVETMGMFQPGVVRRRDGQPAEQPAPAPQPEPEPQPEPMDLPEEPAPAAAPAPAPAPAPTPVAEPTRVEQPAPRAVSVEQLLDEVRRAEAQRVLAEANAAYESARYADAAERYAFLLEASRNHLTAEQVTQAQDRLAASRTRLRGVGLTSARKSSRAPDSSASAPRHSSRTSSPLPSALRRRRPAKPAACSLRRTHHQPGPPRFNESEIDTFTSRVRRVGKQIESRAEQLRVSTQSAKHARRRAPSRPSAPSVKNATAKSSKRSNEPALSNRN